MIHCKFLYVRNLVHVQISCVCVLVIRGSELRALHLVSTLLLEQRPSALFGF
jgi:hypothetical protein